MSDQQLGIVVIGGSQAGLAVGYWKGQDDVTNNWQVERTFEPKMSKDHVEHRRGRWREALDRAGDWEERSAVEVKEEIAG